MKSLIKALPFFILFGFINCDKLEHPTQISGNPAWVDQMISQYKNGAVTNPPMSIYKYGYNGNTVYYLPPRCCDIPSVLYDADGNILCLPDGGFSGGGDGKCSDFMEKRTNEVLVWKDTRSN